MLRNVDKAVLFDKLLLWNGKNSLINVPESHGMPTQSDC